MTVKRILCYLQQMQIQRYEETPHSGIEKRRLQSKSYAPASITNLNNRNHHGTQNMISPFSPQEDQLNNPLQKILLPPTDLNAEVEEIPLYKLVYVNGACPKAYRVYKAHSMIGVIFQHISHWSNAVDKIRYAKPVDAAVGLDEFLKVTRISKATTEQPLTEEELLDIEFDSLTSEDWERLKRYVPQAKHLVAA